MERAMMDAQIQYPAMRLDLCAYFGSLVDEDLHRRAWTNRKFRSNDPSAMMVFHFFFDDTSLFDDPSSCIGWFLKDEREADAIRPLTAAMEVLADHYDLRHEAELVASPEWQDVLVAARAAHALICGGGIVGS